MLYLLDLFGVAVFAISGALSAGRKGMDFLGVVVVAAFTAIGGGTLRDIILDRHPIFWIADPVVLYVIGGAALFTLCYVRFRPPPGNSLLWADAMGLALFTLSGTQIGEAAGLAPVIVVLMGTMTGAAGGVMRDILCAEVPLILRRDLYASAAIGGSSLYLVLKAMDVASSWAFGIGMAAVFMLRLLAMAWGISLPVFHLPQRRA
jgi:uncharacterized membrane protein YeiH